GPDKTLVFIRDDVTLASTEVTRQGVADQINAAAGLDIAKITGDNTLEFEADALIIIRGNGTANSVILGGLEGTSDSFVGSDQRNVAPHAGTHIVESVDSQNQVTFTEVPINGTSFSSPY